MRINALVFRVCDSEILLVPKLDISSLLTSSMVVQAGFCQTHLVEKPRAVFFSRRGLIISWSQCHLVNLTNIVSRVSLLTVKTSSFHLRGLGLENPIGSMVKMITSC